MTEQNRIPQEGECLPHWINRNRPDDAPEVHGEPTFDPDNGFLWTLVGGWKVSFEQSTAGVGAVACWHCPEGHPLTGFEIGTDGKRSAALEEGEMLDYWPEGVELDNWYEDHVLT